MPLLRLFLVFSFLCIFSGASGQQYNFRNYNVEDGLGQSQVYAVFQDKTGILWLGTRGGGISLFDGFEFTSITNKDGIPNNYINSIQGDSKGNIWIGTNYGLSCYNGENFETIDFGSLIAAVVYDIHITGNDEIYLATNKGILEVKNGKTVPVGKDVGIDKMSAQAVLKEGKTLWFGTNSGLYSYTEGQLVHYAQEARVMGNAITTLESDQDGNLWIGTYGDGIYCYNKKDFFRIDFHHELYRHTVLDIYSDASQNLWIATLRGGVIHYDKNTKTFTSISENEGLSNNHVRCILPDQNGNFWFGTSGGGICHYLGKQFTTFDQRSGLAGNFIYSVIRDSRGNLWVGNSQKGVSVLTTEGIRNYHAETGFEDVKVKAIAEDGEGNIWLGTDGHGVYVYKDDAFTPVEALDRAYVKQMKRDSEGNIWIATAGSGLIKASLRNGNYIIEKWLARDGLLSNRLTSLHIDKNGRVWYGTESHGVGCFSTNHRTTIRLRATDWLSSDLIRSLTEDKSGRLWIGTAGEGICAYNLYKKPDQKRFITIDQGLKSNNVYLLTTDKDGNVIVGTEKGLDYVYLNKDGSHKQIRNYGKLDGFTGVETCQNSVWNDNGSIWFGTINGLCRFNPSELVRNAHAPTLSFKDIKLFYETILDDRENALIFGQQIHPLHLSYYENHITFEFLGVNMKRPEGVTYKWKLKGFDDEWSPPSKDRSIMYSNLGPGKYTFLLKAANEDGVWSEKPLTYEFEIETPYWQTTWFRSLIIIGAVLLLVLIYILTIIRIRKKARIRQREVEMEKDLLELEQKAMRLQMNPHFIFNALNSIQSLIGTGKEKEARYYLAKFSRLMRQILDNSRQSIISLEEEINTLENYLLIEQFCNGGRFNYEINVNPNMETDFINIPPMLIQPFIENAIKHGMKGRTDEQPPGKITITFSEKNGILECIIEDNGIGRERAAELKKASKETYHKSTALAVTTDRLKKLDASGDINPLEIVDLYDDGKASGTRVIIRLPID